MMKDILQSTMKHVDEGEVYFVESKTSPLTTSLTLHRPPIGWRRDCEICLP